MLVGWVDVSVKCVLLPALVQVKMAATVLPGCQKKARAVNAKPGSMNCWVYQPMQGGRGGTNLEGNP